MDGNRDFAHAWPMADAAMVDTPPPPPNATCERERTTPVSEFSDMEGLDQGTPAPSSVLLRRPDDAREQHHTTPNDHSSDLGFDQGTPAPSPITTPPPCTLTVDDPSIHCVCPAGMTRHAKDIAFDGMGEFGPAWTHITCNPQASSAPAHVESTKVGATGGRGTTKSQTLLLCLLGPHPTAEQRLKVKNFTSTFHCDGPCAGSSNIFDFTLCRKCCAWQHNSCMLYGDSAAEEGQVCNRCYMSFIFHRDEIVSTQRKQLVQAVKYAYEYLNNPETRHQASQRGWCRKFIARFLEHNQRYFRQWIDSRRTRLHPRFLGMPPRPAVSIQNPENDFNDEETNQKPVLRKRRSRNKEPSASPPSLVLDDEQDESSQEVDDLDDDNYLGNSDRIVMSQLKAKKSSHPSTSSRRKPYVVPKKPTGKRKAERTYSLTPPGPDSQIFQSSAPRKSARKSLPMIPIRGDSDNGDDDEPLVSKKSRRRQSAPSNGADNKTSCKCESAPQAKDCFKCTSCQLRQHKDCADDNQDGLPVLCNFCFSRPPMEISISSILQPLIQKPPVPQMVVQQPAALQPSVQSPEDVNVAIREEVDQLCASLLWKEYCTIPDSSDDIVAAMEHEMMNPPKAELPKYAPPAWLEEIQSRTSQLLDAAGPSQANSYLLPVISTFPRQTNQILKALRELAIEQVFRGAYKGKRKELGLLAEVLGLEEKGRYWKGFAS